MPGDFTSTTIAGTGYIESRNIQVLVYRAQSVPGDFAGITIFNRHYLVPGSLLLYAKYVHKKPWRTKQLCM